MTPLGMAGGTADYVELKSIKARGGRHYCEIPTTRLRLHLARRRKGYADLRLSSEDKSRYEVYVWVKPDDPEFLSFVEGRFARGS